MLILNDKEGNDLPDELRLTYPYRLVRRFKIDEIPQLFNVLKGDMSLVGPRPWITSLIEKFDEEDYIRFKVKPGLTGLAQIHGNIHLSWKERLHFDKYYVENLSFIQDVKIILRTFLILLFGDKWGLKN